MISEKQDCYNDMIEFTKTIAHQRDSKLLRAPDGTVCKFNVYPLSSGSVILEISTGNRRTTPVRFSRIMSTLEVQLSQGEYVSHFIDGMMREWNSAMSRLGVK